MDQLKNISIKLTMAHISQMISIAEQQFPNEACGIIAGVGRQSQMIFEITNALESPVEFLMDAAEMVSAFWEMEKNNWEPVAFFHSHPVSPPLPSRTDLERNYYPETPHIIIGKVDGEWVIKAFMLGQKAYYQVNILTD